MQLKVRSCGTAMVPDIDAMEAKMRQYVGWKLDPTQGDTWTDERHVQHRQAVFVRHNDVVSLPSYPEYIRCVLHGDLAPADVETAKYCGVPFAPFDNEDTQ